MVSHVEMGLAAGGFKLFGKVITQCAESAPPPQDAAAAAASGSTASSVARERDDPDERDQPVVKREAASDSDSVVLVDKQQRSGSGGPAPAESEDSKGQHQHPRPRQQQDTAEARAAASAPPLPCPRCRSRSTKFCYFNNYNVNQPRHFCKDCHRYWTAGGALRNVPVGAGRRKNRPVVGPVVAAPVPVHPAAAAALVLGFPGQHPSSPTSPSLSPVYAERWPVCPDPRF